MLICPPPNPLWLQALVTGAPALLIGLLAWLVSRGQLLVAKEKLRHDLFERRFAVFYAFETLLLRVAMTHNREEVEEASKATVAKLATARFLFDQDQFKYLRETFKAAVTLHSQRDLLNDPAAWNTRLEQSNAITKHTNDRIALFDKIDEVATKLASKLSLRDFGPR